MDNPNKSIEVNPYYPDLEQSKLIEQYYRLILHEDNQRFAIAYKKKGEVFYPHSDGYLTHDEVISSIEGEVSLGVMLNQDKTYKTKSGCIDIDTPRDADNLTEGLALAKKLQETALTMGIKSYIEFSGNRGYHLWIFSDIAITGEAMINCLKQISLKCEFNPEEIFPSKKDIEHKAIKLPSTTHLKNNQRCGFISPNFNPNQPKVDLYSQANLMANFAQNEGVMLCEIALSYKSPSDKPKEYPQLPPEDTKTKLNEFGSNHPSCINHLLSHGVPLEIDYNNGNMTLARYCVTRGYSLDDSLVMATTMAKNTHNHHSGKVSLEDRVGNFKSVFNSANKNKVTYTFQCSFILANYNKDGKGKLSDRGCIGSKCSLFCPKDGKPNSDNLTPSDNTPKPKGIPLNSIIYQAVASLNLEDKELCKSSILLKSESIINSNEVSDDITDTISDGTTLMECEVLGYILQNPDNSLDCLDLPINSFMGLSNQPLSDYLDYLYGIKPPTPDTLKDYLSRIREQGVKLSVKKHLQISQNRLREAESVIEVISSSMDGMESILRSSMGDADIESLDNQIPHLAEGLFTKFVPSIATLSPHLNNVLNGGLMKGKLYVIGAPPASGKSTLCSWLGDYASSKGFRVVYASFEMSREQLFVNSLARVTGINSAHIEARRWMDKDYNPRESLEDRIKQGIWDLMDTIAPHSHILECDDSHTPNKLKAIAKKLKADLLIVDYLQLLSSGDEKLDSSAQETLRVSKIATELKRLARGLNIPVIAISDINKKAYQDSIAGGDLDMGALRDSFKIAHSADVIMLLQSGVISLGKGDNKTLTDQLDLIAKKYPENEDYIKELKSLNPLEKRTADTYSRLTIVKNRGGKLGEPLFKYSRALHNFLPLELEINYSQDDCDF